MISGEQDIIIERMSRVGNRCRDVGCSSQSDAQEGWLVDRRTGPVHCRRGVERPDPAVADYSTNAQLSTPLPTSCPPSKSTAQSVRSQVRPRRWSHASPLQSSEPSKISIPAVPTTLSTRFQRSRCLSLPEIDMSLSCVERDTHQ